MRMSSRAQTYSTYCHMSALLSSLMDCYNGQRGKDAYAVPASHSSRPSKSLPTCKTWGWTSNSNSPSSTQADMGDIPTVESTRVSMSRLRLVLRRRMLLLCLLLILLPRSDHEQQSQQPLNRQFSLARRTAVCPTRTSTAVVPAGKRIAPSPGMSPFDSAAIYKKLSTPQCFTSTRRRITGEFSAGSSGLHFGVSFAAATVCTVNICVNGTCYENAGLQICVCDPPFTGPLCTETISMCKDGCGIRLSSGVDCASALCSLGECIDIEDEPYYKCDCGDFFTGDNCEHHNNPCTNPAASPCGHGRCSFAPGKGSGTVTCQCDDEWETPFGAGVTTVKWGDSEVIQSPPCTVRKTRGIAKIQMSFSSAQLLFWWCVFGLLLLLLVWCCYTVASESCTHWLKVFRSGRAATSS